MSEFGAMAFLFPSRMLKDSTHVSWKFCRIQPIRWRLWNSSNFQFCVPYASDIQPAVHGESSIWHTVHRLAFNDARWRIISNCKSKRRHKQGHVDVQWILRDLGKYIVGDSFPCNTVWTNISLGQFVGLRSQSRFFVKLYEDQGCLKQIEYSGLAR